MRLLVTFLTLLSLSAAAQSPVPSPPAIGAPSYILIDYHSGTVLAEQNAGERAEPASITKVMTTYIVFQELERGNLALDDEVVVSETAWRTGGSRMFVEVGDRVRLEDLLRGVIIQSGNDASVALAEHIAGSEETFAEMMNQTAAELGMADTHFRNATGWPHEDHYSTPRDIATLSAAIIRDFPQYYAWYSEREFTFNDIRQHNRNRLLWRDPSVDGLKTGHTEAAGYCLATSAKREGMRLISVVMGSASEDSRASETQSLLNYGFRFFETVQLYAGGDHLSEARVWKGRANEVELGVADTVYATIPRDRYPDLEARVELEPRIFAPIEAGAALGELVVELDDQEVLRAPLVAMSEVERAGIFGRGVDSIRLWLGGLFGKD